MTMHSYLFDVTLAAAVRVEAPDVGTARGWLYEQIDCATANLGAFPNGDPMLAEVSVHGAIVLASVDDVEIE
jgi:hypothetical protein